MAQIQAARANTLDTFLEELPEIPAGYFSFPVDDFFDNYVEELGQRGGQGSGSLPSGSNPPPGRADATLVVIAMTTLVSVQNGLSRGNLEAGHRDAPGAGSKGLQDTFQTVQKDLIFRLYKSALPVFSGSQHGRSRSARPATAAQNRATSASGYRLARICMHQPFQCLQISGSMTQSLPTAWGMYRSHSLAGRKCPPPCPWTSP